MENKTKKAKSNNFKTSNVIKGYRAFVNIGDNYALPANSTKNMLIRVLLHAEFISSMKTVQIPTIFVKNAKE